jgi:integrase
VRAGVTRHMRAFHDWRHCGITSAAAAGMDPLKIMAIAGHANFATTQRYIRLAEVVFSDEVSKLEAFFGAGAKGGCQDRDDGAELLATPVVRGADS